MLCSVRCTELSALASVPLGLFLTTRYGDLTARLLLAMTVLLRVVVVVVVTRWAAVGSLCPASLAQPQVGVAACYCA